MSRSKVLKGVWLALFTSLFLFLLTACGTAGDTSGLSGAWILKTASGGTVVLPDGTTSELPIRLKLNPGGDGMISDGNTEGRIEWNYEQSVLTIYAGSLVMKGYPEGNELILSPEKSEVVLRFAPEQEDQPEEDSASETESETEFPLPANDWYGWWKTEESAGEMPVSWYDCCASFQMEYGLITMVLWDEDGSREDPLSEITFTVEEDGALLSQNGYFLYQDVLCGDWRIQAENKVIYLESLKHESESDSFRFEIYLRPWGDRWKSAPDGQKPFYFDDWYLPLVKKRAPMPDSIPWQKLEENRETLP